MNRIWTIARHEYLVNVRRTGFLVMTALIPLLGLLALIVATLFGGQAGAFMERQFGGSDATYGVVDHLGAFTPPLPGYEEQFHLFSDEAAGMAALQNGEVDGLFVIPSDYIEDGRARYITADEGFMHTASAMAERGSVRMYFTNHLLRDQVDPILSARLSNPVSLIEERLAGEGPAGDGAGVIISMIVPYFLGLLLVITIFTSSGYLLRSVTDEKSSRVIEIVISSVSARELLAGKVLGLGAVGLTQMVVWLLSFAALSGGTLVLLGVALPLLNRPEVFLLALLYYLLGFLIYAVLMASVGALGTTTQESQQLAGIFSMTAAVPMMTAGFLFSNPNWIVGRVLSWIPLTAPTMMLLRIPLTQVPIIDIVGSIVLCAATIPLILWAGAKVFRTGLLMYGKRPSVKEIVKIVREA